MRFPFAIRVLLVGFCAFACASALARDCVKSASASAASSVRKWVRTTTPATRDCCQPIAPCDASYRAAAAAEDAASSARSAAQDAAGIAAKILLSNNKDSEKTVQRGAKQPSASGQNRYSIRSTKVVRSTWPGHALVVSLAERSSKLSDYVAYIVGSEDASERQRRQRTLGQGDDIVVQIDEKDFTAAVAAHDSHPSLFLNGMSMGDDATVLRETKGGITTLRFTLSSGKSSQALWSSLYRQQGIAASTPLEVGVGWKDALVFTEDTASVDYQSNFVIVSSLWTVALAAILCAILLAFFRWTLVETDLFRAAPTYPWWGKAQTLRAQILVDLYPKLSRRWVMKRRIDLNASGAVKTITETIRRTYGGFDWPTSPSKLSQAASDVFKIRLVPSTADEVTTVVSLAISETSWRPIRLEYSLARVQWGLWMMFAVVAGVFLWVVYGSFQPLGGSVLALASVSAITAGASVIVDNNNGTVSGYSHGFLRDILTDPNNTAQAHRFQAVVVNVLLLTVGVVYVCQYLAYPIYDSSWLGLLGLSGFAQTAGKQLLEKPPVNTTTTSASSVPAGRSV